MINEHHICLFYKLISHEGGNMLKRNITILFVTVCTIVSLSGCGRDKIISTGNEKLANAVYNDDTVSLAAYTGLEAAKKNYIVTDEALNRALREDLSDFTDYKTVTRASKDGDIVCIDYTAKIEGETYDKDNDYSFILGDHEYGVSFDQKLTGVSAGDELVFSLQYDEDYSDMDFAGNTVDYDIRVKEVQEIVLPDTTDEFIKSNFDYNTYDEYIKALRNNLEKDYALESESELQESLLQQVIDASRILQYTKGEYEDAYTDVEASYADYAQMFGTDLDSIYESFELTEDDLEQEAMDLLSRTLVIHAIQKSEGFELTDDEYKQGIAYYMEQEEYDSEKEFLKDYSEDEIRRQLLEDKTLRFLVENAHITEIEADYEDY